jgi:protein-tyrosine phosphatase
MYRIRRWLYVGKYSETLNLDLLRAREIGAVLQVAEAVTYPDRSSLYLPVEDGQPLPSNLLAKGLAYIEAEKAAGHSVLVACGAGISRSVTFAIAALRAQENLPLVEAFRQIRRVHPEALPHPALWRSLCAYYGQAISFDEYWAIVQSS